jgi:hypothetical protein
MPRPLALAAAPSLAVLALAAVPAAGQASTIAPAQQCVSSLFDSSAVRTSYQPMTGTISGGVPGGRFTISGKGGQASFFSGTFDAAGNAAYSITSYGSSGIKPSKGRTVTLEVSEPINGVSTVTGQTNIKKSVVALDFDITSPRRLSAKRSVKVSGTPFAGKTVYAFVVRGTKGKKVLRKVSLGKTNACGYTSRKVSLFRTSRPSTGTYTVYLNAGSKLNKSASIYKRISVYRRFF